MTEYDANIMSNNISYFQKEYRIRIGDLERNIGVSPGYLSRSREAKSKPSVEVVMRIAEFLHISMDSLVRIDFGSLTSTEQYLINFIEKLIFDTDKGRLNWIVETIKDLEKQGLYGQGETKHPLLSKQTFWASEYYDGPAKEVTANVFYSYSFAPYTRINGDCYHLHISGSVVLYLMDIREWEYRTYILGNNDPQRVREVWLVDGNKKKYLCSDNDKDVLNSFVEDLFIAVKRDVERPKLEWNFKSAIDSFMENDSGTQTSNSSMEYNHDESGTD